MQRSGFPADDAGLQRLLAVEIDVQCALALSRSALRALASLSVAAGEAIEACLGEEQQLAGLQESKSAHLIAGVIQDLRDQLRRSAEEIERIRGLEDLLIREATALPPKA